MEITFADGTRLDVPAAALDDFLLHDLKWVEFVHGLASDKLKVVRTAEPRNMVSPMVKRCPSNSPGGC